jgi:hypothetical protein
MKSSTCGTYSGSGARYAYFSVLGVFAIDERDIADALDQVGTGVYAQLADVAVAQLAVTDPQADLYEFVMRQRGFKFRENGIRQAFVGHGNDGLQFVPETAQVFQLGFVKHAGRF